MVRMHYNPPMEEQDEIFMKLAIAQAMQSKQTGDVPFGAIVVQNNQVIAAACNSEHIDQDVTKHAEVKAISRASRALGRRDLSDCTIYSTAEPCPMCASAIFHSCIKRVVFGMSRDDLPHLFRVRNIRLWDLAKDWHYTPEVIGGILKQQAIDAFSGYEKAFRVEPTAHLQTD